MIHSEHAQLFRVAAVPASLKLKFLFGFDGSHNYRQLLLMDIDSRHPIRHRLPPGGNGERAGFTLTWVSGYPLPPGERQRTIYSLDHALSGSNLHSALEVPMSFRSRHSQPFSIITGIEAIFMGFRGPKALTNLHGCSSALRRNCANADSLIASAAHRHCVVLC
jgi:hypothetical protein